jgi:hypothetical protein
VDLSGVTAIDAAGIGALVSLQATRTRLRLVDPFVTVRQVLILRLTNLDSVFDMSESECRKETIGTLRDGWEFMLPTESACRAMRVLVQAGPSRPLPSPHAINRPGHCDSGPTS